MLDLKKSYARSLQPGVLHFAAHSHHLRPDITRDATMQCWDDAARMLDRKWGYIFGTVIPEAQKNVAELLGVGRPENIAFAGNTHEFVARILSAFNPTREKPLRVLTTDSEFNSFTRQMARTAENPHVHVTKVPVSPRHTFAQRLMTLTNTVNFDLIFFSQVFYNSGFRIPDDEMEIIVDGISQSILSSNAVIVIDGYHGFCAVPTSLKAIEDRVFYLAGGYKYAQWGEGACFLYVPPACTLRPENTGWFASFGTLEKGSQSSNLVSYSDDAFRFWGATFDPAGLYRLNAVCDWMREKKITAQERWYHVLTLQSHFLQSGVKSRYFELSKLVTPLPRAQRGNFLSFDQGDEGSASTLVEKLAVRGVIVDSRGPLIRIGFGIYHDLSDVDQLIKTIESLEAEYVR